MVILFFPFPHVCHTIISHMSYMHMCTDRTSVYLLSALLCTNWSSGQSLISILEVYV